MKKIFFPCALIIVGAMAGYSISFYVENQKRRELYKSWCTYLVIENYNCLLIENSELLKNYQEQGFVGFLRTVRTLTDPKNRWKIKWGDYTVEKIGLERLISNTSDISTVEFNSDDLKQESIELLEQIKLNNR